MAAKRLFDFYSGQFDTLEIDDSLYRLPKAETLEKWREQAPAEFRYAVKAAAALARRIIRLAVIGPARLAILRRCIAMSAPAPGRCR
ncbi:MULTISPECIES: DUF72 domain-containing protein [unclassified Sphingomonas]|uniref:DUF72 domain-containing protein n=1 Tax=unclassified Sphingomonas TaxID=196159 RepID=UPI0006F47694|nr:MULTISPECIES: DUF72 domain-containing protein [unclassified Sphingomonas]KQX25066.1 hypothetical protein ASD17_23600 [Sphingomonas sp. Root1294]KQY66083.1 hypothetical protein ASD39_13400 [Sphingomonas sp. Root50]KRB89754.1 hypothetical protein ASE22_19195 [Sphingomonas sp. Root720]